MNLKVIGIKITEQMLFLRNKIENKKEINYKEEFKKIAIIITKPLGIGDLIMTTPLFLSMKKEFPKSKIELITDKEIADKIEGIDKINIVKGNLISLNKEFKKLRKEKYNLVIIPTRGVNQYFYAKQLKSKYYLGYWGGFRVLANFKLKKKTKFKKNEHFTFMGLHLAESLGIKTEKKLSKLEFNKKTKENTKKKIEKLKLNKKKKTIMISPHVAWKSRMWAEENYVKLIKQINDKYNIILIGGKDAIETNKNIEKETKKETKSLTGKLNLKESIYGMKYADLFIGSDSGPMHFALIMKRPTIAFFGPVLAKQRIPLDRRKNIKTFEQKTKKKYNYEKEVRDKNANGLKNIKVEEIEKAINKLMKD